MSGKVVNTFWGVLSTVFGVSPVTLAAIPAQGIRSDRESVPGASCDPPLFVKNRFLSRQLYFSFIPVESQKTVDNTAFSN